MKAVKFNFGDDFDAQTGLEAKAREERLRQTTETAFQKGFVSGKAEASGEIAKEFVAVMERVADQVNELFGQRAQLEDRIERDATQLAVAMARKLAASALEMHPHAEIETLITDCMESCREQPKIVVRLSEEQCEPLAAKIEELKQRNAFNGDVILIGDSEIPDGDCLVEWPDGGAERRTGHISQAIEKLVQAFIMKPPVTEQTDQPEQVDPDSGAATTEQTEGTADEPAGSTANTGNDEAQDESAPTMEQPGAS